MDTELFALRYLPLDHDTAISYARRFLPSATAAELPGPGNVNQVFRVIDDAGQSVIVKQALPYLKIVGDSWPLTLGRARIEAEALKLANQCAPGLTPALIDYDPAMAVVVMEDLQGFEVWRSALMAQRDYPAVPAQVGEYCARMFVGTSDFGMPPSQRKLLSARFCNPELCGITEALVFTDPFQDAGSNNFGAELVGPVRKLWSDRELQRAACLIRYHFRTTSESLIHGDLHTGSILAGPAGGRIIDTEFSFVGPVAYDIGVVLGNLLISFLAHRAQHHDRFATRLWLAADQFWSSFTETLAALWPPQEPWQDRFLARTLQCAARYAGTKLIRRVVGLAHAPDIDEIVDDGERFKAQLDALAAGRALMLSNGVASLVQLWDIAIDAPAV